MVTTDYFPIKGENPLDDFRPGRIKYGTNFMDIPYAWDRELQELIVVDISHEGFERISCKKSFAFFNLSLQSWDSRCI